MERTLCSICGIIKVGETLQLLTTKQLPLGDAHVEVRLHMSADPMIYNVTVIELAKDLRAIQFDRPNVLVPTWYHKLSVKRETVTVIVSTPPKGDVVG